LPNFDPFSYRLDQINNNFLNIEVLKQQRDKVFDTLLYDVKRNYPYLDISKTQTLIFLIDTQSFARTIEGGFVRVFQ
jgi:hypothetical protein